MRPGYGETIALENAKEVDTAIVAILGHASFRADCSEHYEVIEHLRTRRDYAVIDEEHTDLVLRSLQRLARLNDSEPYNRDLGFMKIYNDANFLGRYFLLQTSDRAADMLQGFVRHPSFGPMWTSYPAIESPVLHPRSTRQPIPRLFFPKFTLPELVQVQPSK